MKYFLTLFLTASVLYLSAQLPSSFDLRDYDSENYVSTVKSQQGGTCWTHGTMASMESNLMITDIWTANGETGEPNLAEYHLDWWNGYNDYNNDDANIQGSGLEVHMGGDYRVSTAYLSRLEGAVRDIDGQSYDTPPERYNTDYHFYYAKNVEWYNTEEDLSKIDTLKTKIMNYGAMATCICYDGAFIDGNYNHYQPALSSALPNHSVTIIGWDDNHSTQAAEDGAWLVKNSWGTDWGYDGYFWVSYYDKWSGKEVDMGAVSFIDVEPLQYSKAYYHDYHGWRDTKLDSDSAFNSFNAKESTWIKAVSFFVDSINLDYTIKIYDVFDGNNLQNVRAIQHGSILHRGFHTVDLDMPVSIHDGDNFHVFLYLSKGGQPYDRTSDVPVLLGAEPTKIIVESTANEAESYYFENGEWNDLYFYDDPSSFDNTGNFCIKALAEETDNGDYGVIFSIKNMEGQAISDANISFNSINKISDISGEAVFLDISNQTELEYTISADGYYSQTANIMLNSDSHTEEIILENNVSVCSTKEAVVSIYPNPAKDFFYIYINDLTKNASYKVLNISGQEVCSGKIISNSTTVNTTDLPSGIYFVNIKTETSIPNFKIIIK